MNQIVLAISIVMGTAVLVAAYEHVTAGEQGQDMAKTRSTFAKVVVAGGVVAAGIIYFTNSKPKLNSAPFEDAVPTPPPPPPQQQSVQMPQ
jgi:hypothetical protein